MSEGSPENAGHEIAQRLAQGIRPSSAIRDAIERLAGKGEDPRCEPES